MANFDKEKLLIDIKRKIKAGNTQFEVTDWVRNHYDISRQSIVFYLKEAKELISREMDFNIRDVIIKHAARYENIWSKNFQNPYSQILDNPDGDIEDKDVRKTLFKVKNHYMTAAKALEQKEKMLGIVHNRMDVDLKNEFFEQERKNNGTLDVSNFDLSKLSFKEKIELLDLLKKAKGEAQEELTRVTTTVSVSQGDKKEENKYEEGVVDQFDVEDVEHEEIVEQPKDLRVQKINEGVVKKEVERFEEEFEKNKTIKKKKKLASTKKKLLQKYKKNK